MMYVAFPLSEDEGWRTNKLLGLKPIYTTLPKALGRLSCKNYTGFPCLPLAASKALRRWCHNIFLHERYRPARQTFGRSHWRTLNSGETEAKTKDLLNHEFSPSTCIHHRKDPGTQWPGFNLDVDLTRKGRSQYRINPSGIEKGGSAKF